MWTDMSEIVRPTRDGIHGREYISTAVDIGRKPAYLTFERGEPDAQRLFGPGPPLRVAGILPAMRGQGDPKRDESRLGTQRQALGSAIPVHLVPAGPDDRRRPAH
jgi:hypothetical protein